MSNSEDPREKFKRPLERPSLNLPAKRPSENLPAPVPEDPAAATVNPGGLGRLLDAIAKMLQPKPATPAPAQAAAPVMPAAEPATYTVLVAAMNGDTPDGAASQALFKLLDSKPALKVKPLPRPFQLDNLEDPVQVAAAQTATRHAVAGEDADLLVWGDVAKEGYRLRLSTGAGPEDERLGAFGVTTRIELPLNLGEMQLNLLHAAVLAAAEPSTEVQKAAIRRLLPAAALPLEAMAAKPPVSLSMPQQRTLQMVFGHVCAACSMAVPPSQAGEWLHKAAEAYKAAEKRVGRNDPAWETGLIRKHLAAVMTQWAEKSKDNRQTHLEEAVTHWRAAAEALPRALMPLEWAHAQTRLGVSLFRLDLITGDSELLREALTALQASLQVHTRADAPQRWADIMNTIAQVLEVYGDQLKSPEVLKRAIDTCDLVLEIRTRERTPLAWAATRNTLGSALFLLDKHGGGTKHLAEAVEVLQEALEVFQTHGAKGPAQVAARNLAHVKKLAEDRKGRNFIDPDW